MHAKRYIKNGRLRSFFKGPIENAEELDFLFYKNSKFRFSKFPHHNLALCRLNHLTFSHV